MRLIWILALLLSPLRILNAEIRAVIPSHGPKPVGPYTPGVEAGGYLYVSGQGAKAPDGTMPATFAEQVRQTLENVKAVVEAAGLTMEHVVYTHVYLEDIEKFAEMNRVYAEFFPKDPPARATLGVASLPGTPVEINAVAVKELSGKKPVSVPGYDSGEPLSPGMLTHDRLFVSAMRGRDLRTGEVPADPGKQVDLALDGMKAVCEAAGLSLAHMVFVNPYLTEAIPGNIMNRLYAQRFEFGNTPARATIRVASLPEGAQIEYTGVAVRDIAERQAVRPKNMKPSPTASPCVFAADTLYCSAKSGFIPGPNGGIYADTVENQLRQTMRNLLDNLEEADMDFSHVVAANVYLDDMDDFQKMNAIYAKYFGKIPPARTTVQQVKPQDRSPNEDGRYPTLEQVSLIAVRPSAASKNDAVVRSEQVVVQYDDHFRQRVRWLGDGDRSIILFDPEAQPSIEVNGWECSDFRLSSDGVSSRRIKDPEFGSAVERTLTGESHDRSRQIHLERRVRILLPDEPAGVAIFEGSYRNLGEKAIHLGKVYSQRLVFDRRLAEPEAPSHLFASFQGGAYRWGEDYSLVWLHPGFQRLNFQGLDDRTSPEGEGGGMPLIDVWGPTMGVALAHLEKAPQWVDLPVRVREDGKVEIAIWEKPLAKFNQKEWLGPGETFSTVTAAVIFHRGDFYDPLHTYGELLRARGIAIPTASPVSACKPYWKSWGFGLDFTKDKILGVLPELKRMGIDIANLDDGWFDYYGDWEVNRSPGKFPRGDEDMKEFVREVHGRRFRTNLWWYPLGVSPDSRLAKEHPELLVQDEHGQYPLDDRKVHQLCPAFEPARRHIANMLTKFVRDWDFDGVYVDSVGLTAVPPCFNQAHGHASPLDSFQSLPQVFRLVHDVLHKLKPDPYYEVCICSMPHSPYNMPYYHIANASDPVTPLQARRRIKVEKAIRGPRFCVGDCYQVPLDEWAGYSLPESFESAMGTGAQMTTFYADLSEEQRARWKQWFNLYNKLDLSGGEYLNLYDLAFDKPEIHVVRKGEALYYGIFADLWPRNRRIELRGLSKGMRYEVFDYINGRTIALLSGSDPYLGVSFKGSLLLRVLPSGN